MEYLFVFDDTVKKNDQIREIIGEKGFADVLVKRKTIFERFSKLINDLFENANIIIIRSKLEYNDLKTKISKYTEAKIFHFFSNFVICDSVEVGFSLEKLKYVDTSLEFTENGKTVGAIFGKIRQYIEYINYINNWDNNDIEFNFENTSYIEGVLNIGETSNFIQYITGCFDSRYFNKLTGDDYSIIKSSSNKEKIKAEYNYWYLLPNQMKMWFVQPFNFYETEQEAGYSMERLHMTDLAVKWVHGSISVDEMNYILDKYFYFINHRIKRNISEEEFKEISEKLYTRKVLDRVNEFKNTDCYDKIKVYIERKNYCLLDELIEQYFLLKNKVENRKKNNYYSVIGHGDACFSNMMYNKTTRTLKFIDPKGAINESDLWMNPYYDIAKLSHSICGRYDYFNNDMVDIYIGNDLQLELDFNFDNREFIIAFRDKLDEYGFDYWLVRIYEVSLFLSMLPLHSDNPYKVLGFILNARDILGEIMSNV